LSPGIRCFGTPLRGFYSALSHASGPGLIPLRHGDKFCADRRQVSIGVIKPGQCPLYSFAYLLLRGHTGSTQAWLPAYGAGLQGIQ
jgi:hypothetical protein